MVWDSRAPIGPYLNNTMPPYDGAFAFPTVLYATGAFSDVPNVVPTDGLNPYLPNSPLWSDGALKNRWMADLDRMLAQARTAAGQVK